MMDEKQIAQQAAANSLLDAITRCDDGQHERARRLLTRARAIKAGQGEDLIEYQAALLAVQLCRKDGNSEA